MLAKKMFRDKPKTQKAGKLNAKMIKSEHTLRKIKIGKCAVVRYLLSMKIKNYLTPFSW